MKLDIDRYDKQLKENNRYYYQYSTVKYQHTGDKNNDNMNIIWEEKTFKMIKNMFSNNIYGNDINSVDICRLNKKKQQHL